eukprot:gnl/TRDRNA2_/TRDRNA2_95507_c1_seq2.p3 gnl/TRDRNA2_/TRDRNA2_95507_c1~~gnl/TRDRNA2_/TRDRNA2_95507_c1_seq2.p3  ORF type:complete len:109 (-),score=13.72 gnl/TRDRNA2_/TRDRNA2_95507_c1_seq2:33-326(-)
MHWEAGLLGHVLYLAAEAIPGLRGTGIGAFFGPMVAQVLELPPEYQAVYHFAVGGPVDDSRIQTDPPYAHLSVARGQYHPLRALLDVLRDDGEKDDA